MALYTPHRPTTTIGKRVAVCYPAGQPTWWAGAVEAIIASGIAVLGTLLGSGITLVFQQRAVDKGHDFAQKERLRQERLDAYSAYASALINYRRCLVHL